MNLGGNIVVAFEELAVVRDNDDRSTADLGLREGWVFLLGEA